MDNIIEVIVELSRMQGQAIDRAQAEVLNTAIEQGYDKYQASKTFNLNKSKDIGELKFDHRGDAFRDAIVRMRV